MVLRDLQGGDRVCVHEYRHWRWVLGFVNIANFLFDCIGKFFKFHKDLSRLCGQSIIISENLDVWTFSRRETGVAFTWLEAEQSEPNLTLAAGIVREGCRLLHAGYLGDIVTSPFIAFAVEVRNAITITWITPVRTVQYEACVLQLEPEDAADVFKKANDQYATRSTDAAERHLNRIAFELQHQCDYQPRCASVACRMSVPQYPMLLHCDDRGPPSDLQQGAPIGLGGGRGADPRDGREPPRPARSPGGRRPHPAQGAAGGRHAGLRPPARGQRPGRPDRSSAAVTRGAKFENITRSPKILSLNQR